ncbi:hypothetical protein IU449_26865 [Nocardia higoensis]|uniref:Uncharacterized protein n=1 Tax=Nocardia higoensis TaxID=228599 RepID=A0ABS0DI36_9NOCA|nr:hypothetical protein [Nocardia higoensis]MBF6358122.1 hypothetical protein [Nocardia higoensis]
MILSRDIIDLIGDYRRYADLSRAAARVGRLDHEAAFRQLSVEALAQVTDEQLAAYFASFA